MIVRCLEGGKCDTVDDSGDDGGGGRRGRWWWWMGPIIMSANEYPKRLA